MEAALLKGKKTVITGGTAGIGKAIACLFASEGADVAIIGTHEQRGKEALQEIERERKESHQQILFELVDVSQFQKVEEVFQKLLEKWGEFDVLVNNAGITRDQFLIKMKEEEWDEVLAVNLKSVFNTSRIVSRAMMKSKKGKIINIASIIGLVGNAAQTNYAASKAGVIGFTKALAKELARKNICVNCIAPGYIQTRMTETLSEGIKESLLAKIPLNRLGVPMDVAKAALFLASDMSDYMTGQVLTVDGGMVI